MPRTSPPGHTYEDVVTFETCIDIALQDGIVEMQEKSQEHELVVRENPMGRSDPAELIVRTESGYARVWIHHDQLDTLRTALDGIAHRWGHDDE